MNTILIIEDDTALLEGLRETLSAEHFRVSMAATAQRGLDTARREPVDLIILDLRLPDRDGADVCRDLRREGNTTPILVLSAKKGEMDKVLLLEIGADDYLTKPFSSRELVARIRAMIRRGRGARPELEEFTFGDVYVDFRKHELTRKGKPVNLTTRELKLLKYLVEHEGLVVTRDMLLNDVWGYDQFPTTRTVDNYILSLRKKIEEKPAAPRHILTVYTSGYKFVK